ncbi:MAG: hypothetical protein WA964_04750 [Ilumatobacter sp.]|uniref:hypothetical protein n=1 Tax=Ilumatobacter sp. TaxID=1967498 RepID=UPI003C730DAA
MSSPTVDDVPSVLADLLRRVRRRIRLAWSLATAERWAWPCAALVLGLILAARAVSWGWLQPAALAVLVAAAFALAVGASMIPLEPDAVARSADRGLGTHDALSSALQFRSSGGADDVFSERIVERAMSVARRADPRDAVPLHARWRPFVSAGVLLLIAAGLILVTAPRSDSASASERDRAALADEAAALNERADDLRADEVASPDQLTLADQLDELAEELQRADGLDDGLAALDQAQSELDASIDDTFLAEKSAVQGLDRSLAAQPLGATAGSAAEQLAALGDELDGLSDTERAALAERLAAAAEAQSAGNPAAAAALGDAAASLSAGDVSGAASALADASDAQAAGEQSVSDQAARANSADQLADASDRLESGDGDSGKSGDGEGRGQGDGSGDGQGSGSGQGSGQGQGQGGSGSPSGQVTGAPGGTGQGQGGQGTPNGTGQSTETGDADAPTIWLPGGASDEQFVDGQVTSDDTETVGSGQAVSSSSGARVPVDDVITSYRDEAVAALDRGQVSPSSRELVQRYFDAISGGG